MKPLVSIIIPTFNREHLIAQTLESVQKQTYSNWECIIVDDGSTDNTQNVVSTFIKSDNRFSFFHRPIDRVKGANACRNYGFELSRGAYINWLDSDDLLSVSKIEHQITLAIKTPDALLTCPWGRFDSTETKNVFQGYASYNDFNKVSDFLNALVTSRGYFPIHAYLIPRSVMTNAGLWDEQLIINQDGELMSRVFLKASCFLCARDTSVFYRNDVSGSTSGYSNKEKALASIISWKRIEKRLKKISPQYLRFMKKQVYKNTLRTFPELIGQETDFFKNQIFNDTYKNHILMRIVNKCKRVFKTK